MQFSSIQPIDRTLSGATTLKQSGPGSDGNEGVLSLNFQQYWNLTIRLFRGLTPLQRCSRCILLLMPTGSARWTIETNEDR